MAQLALAVGASLALGPAGLGLVSAGTGFAIGSVVGGILFAPEQPKPEIGDTSVPRIEYGSPIPRSYGHPRLASCCIPWQSEARAIENDVGGKGGLDGGGQTQITYRRDFYLLFNRNDLGEIRRVWVNKKLVFSLAAPVPLEDAEKMNAEAPWQRMTVYRGHADQLPDPVYEAAVGAGYCSALRDRLTVFFQDFDLGGNTQIPLIEAEFAGIGSSDGGPGDLLFYAPYLYGAEDIVDPVTPVIFRGDVTPVGYGFEYYDEWGHISSDGFPTQSSQRADYIPAKLDQAYENDYSREVSYIFQFRRIMVKVTESGPDTTYPLVDFQEQQGGAQVTVRLTYLSASAAMLGIAYTVAGGLTANESLIEVPVGSLEVFTFRLRVRANPPHPTASLATDVYLKSDASSGPLSAYKLLTTIHTGHFRRMVVAGTLEPPGGLRSGVTGFDFRRLKIIRGDDAGPVLGLHSQTLQDVVEAECLLAGMSLSEVDASSLESRSVEVLNVAQVTSPRNVIETLMDGYGFTSAEVGGVLRFFFLGGEPAATIPYDDMGASADTPGADRLPIVDSNDPELPVQVFLSYINLEDDYQQGLEQSDRLISVGRSTSQVQLAIGFTPADAKRLADVQVMRARVESRKFGPFSVMRDYANLYPGAAVLLVDRAGNTFRARLTKKSEQRGVLTFDAVADDATVLNSGALTTPSSGGTVLVPQKVPTDFEVMDISLLRDADDAPGVYVAGHGGDRWPGYYARKSADDVSFATAGESVRKATIGAVTGVLGAFAGGWVFDEISSFEVVTTGGQLASYTRAQLLASTAGAYLVGDEIVQARTAELIGTNTYRVSGLLRGCRGTEWAIGTHAAGERFVALDEATLIRIAQDTSDIGRLAYWRGVTKGRADATATSQPLTFVAESQRPRSVVDVRGTRDTSANLTAAWKRRTRKTTNFGMGLVPLGEESEQYDVLIYASGSYAAVKRTTRVSTPSFAYTAAMQTADFGSTQATVYVEIYQISALAGRGHSTRKTL